MRTIKSMTFLTMDGVIQAPGGPDEDRSGGFEFGGWQADIADEAVGAAIMASMAEPFDLLLGRRTYDIFAGYWPLQEGPIAEPFNAATKYVVTGSGVDLPWSGSVRLDGDVPAKLAELKAQDGPDLLIWGSGVLIPTLLAHGLIDEMTLFTYPLIIGSGQRLFGAGTEPWTMQLVASQTTPLGVVIATYRPGTAGIVTGTVGE